MSKVVQGEALTFVVAIRNQAGAPFDLSDLVNATARIQGTAGAIVKTQTSGAITINQATKGLLNLTLNSSETQSMKPGDAGFELSLEMPSSTRIVQVPKAFKVSGPLF